MKQYRKKSLITAEVFNSELHFNGIYYEGRQARIITKQGPQDVNEGDYLITNPDGEVYPCNPKTFIDTYEEVE